MKAAEMLGKVVNVDQRFRGHEPGILPFATRPSPVEERSGSGSVSDDQTICPLTPKSRAGPNFLCQFLNDCITIGQLPTPEAS
jgi:hypothetical protein